MTQLTTPLSPDPRHEKPAARAARARIPAAERAVRGSTLRQEAHAIAKYARAAEADDPGGFEAIELKSLADKFKWLADQIDPDLAEVPPVDQRLERTARAIAQQNGIENTDFIGPNTGEPIWRAFEAQALAAIEAADQ